MEQKYSYPHVEDYIEVISGLTDLKGIKKSIFDDRTPIVSMARYDVSVVENLAEQTTGRVAYTDRQAELAYKIVLKYERQLAKLHVDISSIKDAPSYRLPIRTIDRTSKMWIKDDLIRLRFPYDTVLIDKVRSFGKVSSGRIRFDQQSKEWRAALTEPNVNFLYFFAKQHNFQIDPEVESIMATILDAEQSTYKIELTLTDDGVTITNAESSLLEYIDKNGGMNLNNLLWLVDNSSTLLYSVSEELQNAVANSYGPMFWRLCSNTELKVAEKINYPNCITEVVKYVYDTQRYPVYIYEPNVTSNLVTMFCNEMVIDPSEVVCMDTNTDKINSKTKLVYTHKIPKNPIDNIPLLISAAGLMFGGERQRWVQTAQKVIFFAPDAFHKEVKVCRLD
jgi:hypothetical protein